MYDNVRRPKMFNQIWSYVDFSSTPVSTVIQNHPVHTGYMSTFCTNRLQSTFCTQTDYRVQSVYIVHTWLTEYILQKNIQKLSELSTLNLRKTTISSALPIRQHF